jgi:hypothetical protein
MKFDTQKSIVHIEANGKPFGDCHGRIIKPHFFYRFGVFVFGNHHETRKLAANIRFFNHAIRI